MENLQPLTKVTQKYHFQEVISLVKERWNRERGSQNSKLQDGPHQDVLCIFIPALL